MVQIDLPSNGPDWRAVDRWSFGECLLACCTQQADSRVPPVVGVIEGSHGIFHHYPIASDSSTTTRSDVWVGNS